MDDPYLQEYVDYVYQDEPRRLYNLFLEDIHWTLWKNKLPSTPNNNKIY